MKLSLSSPATSTQRKNSFRRRKVAEAAIPKSLTENHVNPFMFQRRLPSFRRAHRGGCHGNQSTIRRRALRTRTMEMGIAKTLLTVVLTVTMTTCPLIAVSAYRMRVGGDWGDRETTWLVVAMTMLTSNSWWNSMIYGARMPYFRQMMKRAWCRYFGGVRCCGKTVRSGRKR